MPKVFPFPRSKGLNTITDPVNMKPEFCPVFKNAYINEEGLWAQRPGSVKASQQIGGGLRIESLVQYRKRDGTQMTIAAAGGSLLKKNEDGSWATIRTGLGSNIVSAAVFNDKLVVFNGVNLPFWTDGSTWAELSNLCTDWSYGDVPKYVITYKGRLFVGGRPGARQLIYYCGLQDMNDWISANNAGYIDLSMQVSIASGSVTGLAVWEGYLVFVMGDEIFVWAWTDPQNQGLVKVFPVGAPFGRPVGFGNDLLFASRLGIKSLTRSVKTGELNIDNLSENIEPLVLARMKASGVLSAAIYPALRLTLFHMPPSILVYDYAHEAWAEWTGLDAAAMLAVDYDLFFGGAGGYLYKLDPGAASDDGTAIDMYVETPWLKFGRISTIKIPLWLKMVLGEGSLGALTITEQMDFTSRIAINKTFTADTGSYWRVAKWRTYYWRGTKNAAVMIPLLGRGKAVKFGFKHVDNYKPFAMAATEVIYNEAGYRA